MDEDPKDDVAPPSEAHNKSSAALARLCRGAKALNPTYLLRLAIKEHRSVRVAIGVTGVGAAAALLLSYFTSVPVAVFGTMVMVALMTLLFLFDALGDAIPYLKAPAIVLAWTVLLLTIGSLGSLFASAFFNVPLKLRHYMEPGRVTLDKLQAHGSFDQVGNLLVQLKGVPVSPVRLTTVYQTANAQVVAGPFTTHSLGGDDAPGTTNNQITAEDLVKAREPAGSPLALQCKVSVTLFGRSEAEVIIPVRVADGQ